MAYKEYKVDPYVRAWNCIADGGEVCSGDFDPRNNPDDRRKLIIGIALAVVFVLLFVLCSGCTRRVYVPVERTTTVTEILRDTIVELELKQVRDTVTVEMAGEDTTSYLQNGLCYSYASIRGGKLGHSLGTLPDAKLKDTLKVKHVIIRDSIPYPVPVEVEQKLTFWQNLKVEYGGFSMGAAVAMAFVLGVVMFRERRKRY